MLSIILNILLAYLFMYLGGLVAQLYTKEEKQKFKLSVYAWWSIIIIPQAIWFYIPVGFNVSFLIFSAFYFNAGYLLLTNNRFYQNYSSEWMFKSNIYIFLIFNTLILSFFTITSTKFFQAEKFGNLIDVVEVNEVSDIKDFYYESLEGEVRYIPYKTAFHLAKKALSESTSNDVTLGTVLEIREKSSSIQVINKKTYWVFPLEYSGFFKQYNYGAIDAYIIVEAKKQNPVAELVRSGLDRDVTFSMKKSLGGYFQRNLIRDFHSNYPSIVSSSYKIVIDDNFIPHMVAYNLKANVGMSGFASDGVIIYDFSTEKYTHYTMENSPEWLEINYDINTVQRLINDWGTYRKGYIASIGSIFATKLTEYSYGKGGNMSFVPTKNGYAWFSGMTSEGDTNDSIVNVVFVDTKTGKATVFKSKGVDEEGIVSAVQSTLGKDSDNWKAVMPIKYLINNQEIWITPIISLHTNLVIKMAVIDSINVNKVAVGSDLESALNKFSQLGNHQEKLIENMDKETLSGIIEAFNIVGFNESIISFIRLQESPKVVIECNTSNIKQCLILKVGDNVTFEVIEQSDNTKLVTDIN